MSERAVSAVTLNGTTLIDVRQDTVAAENLLTGETATGADGNKVTGAYVPPAYQSQEKTVTPTEGEQIVTPDSGKDGLSKVTVGGVSSTYVGSEVTRRSSTDLTSNNNVVTAPAGYYDEAATKTVGTAKAAATFNTSKTDQSIAAGTYLTGKQTIKAVTTSNLDAANIKTGVTVKVGDANDDDRIAGVTGTFTSDATLANNNQMLSGVTAYSKGTKYTGSIATKTSTDLSVSGATVTAPAGYYATQVSKSVATTTHPEPTVSIDAATGVVTASHTQTAGYVSAGTTEKTLALTTKAAATITPSETAQEIAAGQYLTGKQTIAAIPSDYVGSGITVDPTPTASGKTVTIPAGYYSEQTTKDVATAEQATPSVSIDSAGKITATATQTAGYVVAGTKTGTKQLTTKAATTFNTSTSDQTIASGTYLTGTQTVKAVTTSNIDAGNIKDGVTVKVGDANSAGRIKNVTGTFTDASTVSSGQTAAAAGQMLSGYSAWVDGEEVKGNIATKTASDLTASGKTVTVPAGYYAIQATKDVANGSVTYPSLENNIVLSDTGSFDEETGIASYVYMAEAYAIEPTVTPGYIDSAPNLGFSRTGSGTIQIPTTYVGPDIERKDANDLTFTYNDSTNPTALLITAPTGYYESDAQRSMSILRATTYYPKTTDQSIAYGKYLAGTQTIKAVKLTNLTAENIKSGVTVKVGDSSDDDRIASITGTAPGWTLLGSEEQAVNTASTSASSATTISIGSAAWTHSKIIYVRIRDKAGPRVGYFYGSDTFFINVRPANGSESECTNAARFIHRYTTSTSGEPSWSQTAYANTTGYGVYAYGITAAGVVRIYRRYNSTNSLTINGTYIIEVYALDYPDGVSPYDA